MSEITIDHFFSKFSVHFSEGALSYETMWFCSKNLMQVFDLGIFL